MTKERLDVVTSMPAKIPSEEQSPRTIEIRETSERRGCHREVDVV